MEHAGHSASNNSPESADEAVFFRVVTVPSGEAPLEIRKAWVGLHLPLVPGIEGPCEAEATGVLSNTQERSPGHSNRYYPVMAAVAFSILVKANPQAEAWWRENTPRLYFPLRILLFPEENCELVNR